LRRKSTYPGCSDFRSQLCLLRAVIKRYLDRVADLVECCCIDNAGQPLAIASKVLVLTYIRAKTQDPDASQALYAASSELEVSDLVQKTFQRLNSAASGLLNACPDARFEDVEEVSFSLVAALSGATRVVFESGTAPDMLPIFEGRMLSMCRAFLNDAANASEVEYRTSHQWAGRCTV
ncbi:hypothetical protein, partial [Paenirhodobacter enshiensis]|uniref:hypothetical protein n=1 Tax=Paenirhodobacter enshiensis TaxID=1105367 RepID=UPI003FA2E946